MIKKSRNKSAHKITLHTEIYKAYKTVFFIVMNNPLQDILKEKNWIISRNLFTNTINTF